MFVERKGTSYRKDYPEVRVFYEFVDAVGTHLV